MTADDDDELVSMTKAIMHTTHGQTVSDEQARGIIALVLAGRQVGNPAAYLRHALAQHDGARYGPPAAASSTATPQPDSVDLITMRKAALLRAGETPAEAAARAETTHRGADLARRMLAERPRSLVEVAELPGELHGPALAAEQAAQSRALRDRLPAPPEPDDDDHQDDDHPDEGAQGAIAQARPPREHMRRWADGTDTHPGETDDDHQDDEPNDEDDQHDQEQDEDDDDDDPPPF